MSDWDWNIGNYAKMTCVMCGAKTHVLVKPYNSRGRFPHKTGAICRECYDYLKEQGLYPLTKEQFFSILEQMKGAKDVRK